MIDFRFYVYSVDNVNATKPRWMETAQERRGFLSERPIRGCELLPANNDAVNS